MTRPDPARWTFLDVAFDRLAPAAAIARVVDLARGDRFAYVVTPNVDHIVQLERSGDPELAAAYRGAALCLCDSRIIARLARWSGGSLPVVAGSDLTRDLLAHGLPATQIAVVGGDAALHRALAGLYPRFTWVFHTPPMGVRRNPAARAAIAEFVEQSGADVVFLAIGAPQSEIVCAEIGARGRARGVALCIGASLEFLTGAKQRAPRWMQRASLEWLYRLGSEPRRLWRRYLVDGPRIFAIWRRWRRINLPRPRAGSGSSPSGGA
ncbi:WecB/TagA/CpsF family glycosyltransferase [Sphingopyxis solisilvae]|uniref:WecB/TagA/CpsF family glycosyltransferase n=1 Tax=Sphingopyxis solisilvae TaxID=1886788 RepID=UPI001892C760|nr:WecB/TagA/CpsF family glycosyltransferase [Sphingopyxis solisilvae]